MSGAAVEWVPEPARRTPVAHTSEVLVVGGGPAGVCAAIGAARMGVRTLLVERDGFLGGSATGGMVASFMGFYWHEHRVTGGLAFEITHRLIEAGGATGFTPYLIAEASDHPIEGRTFPFDPEILKIVLDRMVEEAGVKVLSHSRVVEPLVEEGRVGGVIVEGRSQRKAIRGRVVVDASGDGLVAHKSGAELENKAQDPRSRQPMTLMVRVMDVDVPRFRALPREEKQRLVNLGIERGELFFKSLALVSSPAGHDGFLLMTRVTGRDGSDEEDLTAAEAEGRRQALSVIGYLRREVAGFERCRLVALAPWIGIRETWRVMGDYVLTKEDVLSGRQFPDAIAQGGGPMDVHHATGADLTLVVPPAPFSTPYRCLLPSGVEGLLVAGRCVSATREAMGALRHMGSAMALGHAAGVAAALAGQATVPPRRVDTDELRAVLRAQDAIVDSPLGDAAAGTAGGTR
ncbi:MAG: FAD-dependent oxidoreductase [Candidatus Rokubacteria bacterium]|nr:FAD-dependent oxidoreductase [Candidatus Rokubacteria bacterium]MBI3107323.1 FAD-dependent oxidoreductase [Candidatus Rokubacteria bacterium]